MSRSIEWLVATGLALTAVGCAEGAARSASNDDDNDDLVSGSGASAATGAGGGGGLASSGGAGGATDCVYPTGEIGVLEGKLVDGSLAWQGFTSGSTDASTISIADYHDCDGDKGIDALLVIQSATWCEPCQIEAAKLQEKMDGGWSALGIRVLTLMVQDGSEQPAGVETAAAWKDSFGLASVDVAADPAFSFDYYSFDKHISGGAFPTIVIVDPRTMIVSLHQPGDLPVDAQLEALAAANQ